MRRFMIVFNQILAAGLTIMSGLFLAKAWVVPDLRYQSIAMSAALAWAALLALDDVMLILANEKLRKAVESMLSELDAELERCERLNKRGVRG